MDVKNKVNGRIFLNYKGIEKLIDESSVDELFNHPWNLIICEVLALKQFKDKYDQYKQFLKQQLEVKNGNVEL